MKNYEKIAAALGAVGLPAAFVAVGCIEGGAGPWAWWLGAVSVVLQLTAMALVMTGEREAPTEEMLRRGNNQR